CVLNSQVRPRRRKPNQPQNLRLKSPRLRKSQPNQKQPSLKQQRLKRQLNKLSLQRLNPARKLRPSQQNLQQKHQNLPQSLVQSLVQSQPKSLLLKNQNQQLRSQHQSLLLKNQIQQLRSQHLSQVQSLARNQPRPVLAIIRSRPKRTQPRHDLVPAVEHRVQVTTPSPPSRVCVKNVAEAHSLP